MYEHRTERLLPFDKFLRRLSNHAISALALVAGSLSIGIMGYRFLEHLSWIDALLNASMILGGMGPVDPVKTVPGKLFASGYALYSGLVVLVAAGIIFAPIFHRFLHRFHIEEAEKESRRQKRS
ncbi:MAG TPA: hypothetical protein VKH64_03235 [Candidatus Binatia bacterium]|nr:hypothetical protein [Candidatus Binatia bacterium]